MRHCRIITPRMEAQGVEKVRCMHCRNTRTLGTIIRGSINLGLFEGPSGKRGQLFLIISKGQRSTKNFYSLGR